MNEFDGRTLFDLTGNGVEGVFQSGVIWEADTVKCVDGNDDYVVAALPVDMRTIGTAFSVVWESRHDNPGVLEGLINIHYGVGSGGQIVCIYYNDGTPADLTISRKGSNTWSSQLATAFDTSVFHKFGVTFPSGDPVDKPKAYIDSIRDDEAGTFLSAFGANDIQLGAGLSASYYGSVTFKWFYLYDRELSAEDIAWLHREPYAMFR
jgi:hypothetical protein